jgi:hypothetical protein
VKFFWPEPERVPFFGVFTPFTFEFTVDLRKDHRATKCLAGREGVELKRSSELSRFNGDCVACILLRNVTFVMKGGQIYKC